MVRKQRRTPGEPGVADDALQPYRSKRDFSRTPEPRGTPDRDCLGGRFVIHRHEASRLHYDLRLEIEGVLRSWAVPKGLRYDPRDKVLAVRTEDHPLEYLDFEGTIPLGEYGGGTMQVWDRGVWSTVRGQATLDVANASCGVRDGEIKIVLEGRRVRGEWHLVQTPRAEGRDWLLFKAKDRYAADPDRGQLAVDCDLRAAALAGEELVPPLVADTSGLPADDLDWLFEAEFHGDRVLLHKDQLEIRLEWLGERTVRLDALDEEIVRILAVDGAKIRAANAVVDGVLVEQAGVGTCCYVQDVARFDGLDVGVLPLTERKDLLRRILPRGSARLLFVDPLPGRGDELLAAATAAGFPGILAKPARSCYCKMAGWRRIGADQTVAQAGREGLATLRPRVRFSNLGKVLWPEAGYTKRDLIDYYDAVAHALLPYLRGRPVHQQRFPDGIHGESFFQRQPPKGRPEWLRVERMALTEERAGQDDYQELVVCENRETLLMLANLASIDLHPWMSRVELPDRPDWLVLDLDPKTAPFTDVVRVARAVGRLLRGIGLRPSLKTSGKTGLHVHVPLEPRFDYDQARMFAEGVARAVVRELPDIATVERDPRQRGGRVYVDYLQNRRGQTVVPPYSLRPTVRATASAPLDWDELDSELTPECFDIRTLPKRLQDLGDLFRGTLEDRQDLMPAAARLADLVRK